MEERNILWGELVGGLLIVGCSIALVLSLWQTLGQIPLFPFVLPSTITTALFVAGRYTLHHWKLEATSRGLLVIALLLVPLDFLLAGLSPHETRSEIEIAIKLIGILLFAFFVFRAARDLYPARREVGGWRSSLTDSRLLALSVLGIAISPLPLRRLHAAEAAPAFFMTLAAWPGRLAGSIRTPVVGDDHNSAGRRRRPLSPRPPPWRATLPADPGRWRLHWRRRGD